MWEIWTNNLLPKAIKSCPKSPKWPNLVTLFPSYICFEQLCFALKVLCSSCIFARKREKAIFILGPFLFTFACIQIQIVKKALSAQAGFKLKSSE